MAPVIVPRHVARPGPEVLGRANPAQRAHTPPQPGREGEESRRRDRRPQVEWCERDAFLGPCHGKRAAPRAGAGHGKAQPEEPAAEHPRPHSQQDRVAVQQAQRLDHEMGKVEPAVEDDAERAIHLTGQGVESEWQQGSEHVPGVGHGARF